MISFGRQDTNTPALVASLREAGVELRRVVVIGDEMESISTEVRHAAASHDVVITSGGIGPTHDDLTVAAVAGAFGLTVVRHPDLADLVRGVWSDRVNEAALRLADVPDGARLLFGDDGWLPVRTYCTEPTEPIMFGRYPNDLVGLTYHVTALDDYAPVTAGEADLLSVLWANAFDDSTASAENAAAFHKRLADEYGERGRRALSQVNWRTSRGRP